MKALSFSLSKEKDSAIIGMTLICAKTLFPANEKDISLDNFAQHSVVQTQFQDFARGNWKSAPPERPEFLISEIVSGDRSQEFCEVISTNINELDQIESEEDFVKLIEDRPRYIVRHKFITQWMLHVWKGDISPHDEEELGRLESAVHGYNLVVKRLGDTRGLRYEPGNPHPVRSDHS